jgi:LysR family transcriptional regulator, transcriptional activator of nhaA
MKQLNYYHLLQFHNVAKEGSLRKASEKLRISQSSISVQISALEEALGEKLFRPKGRNKVLTETGHIVSQYAKEIFALGDELWNAVKGMPTSHAQQLNIGIANFFPKLASHKILKPVFSTPDTLHPVCRDGRLDYLLSELMTHKLDIVLADEAAPSSLGEGVLNHYLGDSGVTFCAMPDLAEKLRKNFPQSLQEAPALMPTKNTAMRGALEKWFADSNIHPNVVAEFEDKAMMNNVATIGQAIIPIMSFVTAEALERFNFHIIGSAENCRIPLYAITTQRKFIHPGVLLITENAKDTLFAS